MGLRTLLNALVPIPEEAAVFGLALAAGALLEDRGGRWAAGAGQAVPDGVALAGLADPVFVPRALEGAEGDAASLIVVREESITHRTGLAQLSVVCPAALGTLRHAALLA